MPSRLTEEKDKPLVIIVDELDRCKPTFAVELIEVIKHLFSVPKVVFVLAMHKPQLEEAIKNVYGKDIDSQSYLQKFIHLECDLPKRTDDDHFNDLGQYTARLFELHEFPTKVDTRNLTAFVTALANRFELSLRQLEKVFSTLAVFYLSTENKDPWVTPMISFLAVVKVVDPLLFNKILFQKFSYQEIVEQLDLHDLQEETTQNFILHRVIMCVKFFLLSSAEFANLDVKDKIRNYGNNLPFRCNREDMAVFFAQKLSMFVALNESV